MGEIDEDFKLFMEEVLNEATDSKTVANKINNYVETFYEHALKYKYHKEYQTTTWIHTLFRARNDIRDLYIDSPKLKVSQIKPNLIPIDQLYRNGMKKAEKYNPTCHNKYDVFKEFNTIDDIIGNGRLESFLTANAFTIEVKTELGI